MVNIEYACMAHAAAALLASRLVAALIAQLVARHCRQEVAALVLVAADRCVDLHGLCFRWAAARQCARLPAFMRTECPAACGLCGTSHDPCEPQARDNVSVGALRRTFANAMALTHYTPRLLSRDPPLVVLEDFVSNKEAAQLVELAEAVGFLPNESGCRGEADLCSMDFFACLQRPACVRSATARRLEERMRGVLRLPAHSTESLGFFRYRPGQAFRLHHDQNEAVPLGVAGGPRGAASPPPRPLRE